MMRSILKAVLFVSVGGMFALGQGLMAAPPVPCPIPLEKGNQWTYAGKIETTLSGSSTVFAANICWVMEVVDSVSCTNAEAALVRGFPGELPWYEPGQVPGFCVLLSFNDHVYQFITADEKQAASIMRAAVAEPAQYSAKAKDFNELFALPLAKDKRWGGDLNREDGWYAWRVEGEESVKLRLKGYSESHAHTVYTLAYRTCPDHQLLEIAPGLGITRFVYVHHGTVASVDVHLVSCVRPH